MAGARGHDYGEFKPAAGHNIVQHLQATLYGGTSITKYNANLWHIDTVHYIIYNGIMIYAPTLPIVKMQSIIYVSHAWPATG